MVILPAGQSNIFFNLTVLDNGIVDGNQDVSVSVHAPGFASTQTIIIIADGRDAACSFRPGSRPPIHRPATQPQSSLERQFAFGPNLFDLPGHRLDSRSWRLARINHEHLLANLKAFSRRRVIFGVWSRNASGKPPAQSGNLPRWRRPFRYQPAAGIAIGEPAIYRRNHGKRFRQSDGQQLCWTLDLDAQFGPDPIPVFHRGL